MRKVVGIISSLVGDTKRGKRGAFNKLVLEYQDQLFQTLYRITGDYHEAKDITQEAFLKAYSAIQDFKEQAAFYTWLYRIAINTVISRRRQEGRRAKPVPLDEDSAGPAAGFGGGEGAGNPAANLEAKEMGRLVQEAIQTLEEQDRSVIVLRDVDGFSYEEISEILDVPLGTVKSRLARSREALREKLKGIL